MIKVIGIAEIPNEMKILQFDSDCFYYTRKNLNIQAFGGKFITTYSNGFRCGYFKTEKDKKTFRICCLGDSSTFGFGINDDETYASILDRILNKKSKNRKYEVINCGVISHNTYSGLTVFKKYVLPLKPDLVTISYALNDCEYLCKLPEWDGKPYLKLKKMSKLEAKLKNFLFDNSYIYRFLSRALTLLKHDIRYRSYFKNGNVKNSGRFITKGEYIKNLSSFIELSRKEKIKIMFLFAPIEIIYPKIYDLTFKSRNEGILKKNEIEKRIKNTKKTNMADMIELGSCYKYLKLKNLAKECYYKALNYEPINVYNRKYALEYYSYLRNVARQNGVPFIDVNDIFFNEEYAATNQNLFYGIFHAGKYGHEIIANQIYKEIIRMELRE